MPNILKKIVTIGGGSGHSMLLSGLRDLENIEITAIVAMSDSGSSTGKLREEFGILPPGDILKCIIALSPESKSAKNILLRRFNLNERLKGHNAGNLLIAKLEQYDSFLNGIEVLSEILEIKGRVLPVTLTKSTLVSVMEDGSYIFGEKAIDKFSEGKKDRIRKVFLVPHYDDAVEAYPPSIESIRQADMIIIGSAGFYISIMSNLAVPGIKEAICESNAKLIFISKCANKFGACGFTLRDNIEKLEEAVGRKLNTVIANNLGADELEEKYGIKKENHIKIDVGDGFGGRKIIIGDFLDEDSAELKGDPCKLAKVIEELLSRDV
ncbi:hypothetical protein A2Y83_00655 [Candidatus Falkowbacteria bacterium RBG_13_39_14]|uniref:Gluconeogenesis factor n=1 Tax=Candidatus Falkowbacteria bacterium RBG_13_39_14 TaxID=1797985 RepID=A0A1F5S9D4_9BACT|nr:MAG: hypothetical protein A2Y83_00655 [Candidatus Falkowbacteria bacterium RBG_13_39_14]